ncbi:MAG: Unknown protein [uncultured Sulfurovum sp.]|uniref:DNA methyltransferase n=1 Tax=uncultured Sulfurovum sp. TaxID=269237 RepID=A0A6S6T4J7_9BACT|nr:MAG: Unknown protein [uncultured Sulfurovum sp.]
MEYIMLALPYIMGAIGGNITGKLLPSLNLGTLGNSIAGIVGGGIGGTLLGMVGVNAGAATSLDVASLLGGAGAGAIGGAVVMFVVGLIMKLLSK